MSGKTNDKPRIGISQCLLGDAVRYDGGHKRDNFLTDVLTPFVEWVPICPEVEAGLGIPREPMHLTGNLDSPRLLTIRTKVDHTATLKVFSQRRVQEIRADDLDGYIFKNNSPSCGIHRVKIYSEQDESSTQGKGIFSAMVHKAFPLLPVEEEGRLNNAVIRENFIEQLFGYRRWKTLVQSKRITRRTIIDFHARHKYVLLAHSHTHYAALGKLVSTANQYTPSNLAKHYGEGFMAALKVKSTIKKHVKVLQQLADHLKKHLRAAEQAALEDTIADYHRQSIPLTIPLMHIQHVIRRLPISSLIDQVYLNPHPQELILRNHI
jgi:uncharacterized protein YbbK (DUF523 family)/uncharacterized protein YbgA (DUF1722 family)